MHQFWKRYGSKGLRIAHRHWMPRPPRMPTRGIPTYVMTVPSHPIGTRDTRWGMGASGYVGMPLVGIREGCGIRRLARRSVLSLIAGTCLALILLFALF